MTKWKASPITMISPPNNYLRGEKAWTVTGGQAVDLWGILEVVDSMGVRPFVLVPGGSIQVTFPRGDFIGSPVSKELTVLKVASLDSNFRALFKISLTAAEATNIISGTVMFKAIEGLVTEIWSQNWFVKKINVGAGF